MSDFYFLDEQDPKITAASVGISAKRWYSISENIQDIAVVKSMMKEQRFDHVPITSEKGKVKTFHTTIVRNNFDEIETCPIRVDDIIELDTPIREVIDKFHHYNRDFYFLAKGNQVEGLITLGNFNCRQVKIYLYSLVCRLEITLGEFVKNKMTNNEVVDYVSERAKSQTNRGKYQTMLKSYYSLVERDLENSIIEHFYFDDFFALIHEKKYYEILLYSEIEWERIKKIKTIRNRIMHPTKSLLDFDYKLIDLTKHLKMIDDILFRLFQL